MKNKIFLTTALFCFLASMAFSQSKDFFDFNTYYEMFDIAVKTTCQPYNSEKDFLVSKKGAITKYNGDKNDAVRIPPRINKKSVVEISSRVFENCNLVNVIIPGSVVFIDGSAFVGNKITMLTIGANVKFNDKEPAFDNGFDEFYITQGRTEGTYRYYDKRWFLEKNDNYRDFEIQYNTITGYCGTKQTVRIPANVGYSVIVNTIASGAFYNKQLISVTIPWTIIIIENDAFRKNKLTNVAIPYAVDAIGGGAFYDNQLTEITIPVDVNTIGGGAFMKNPITQISIGADVSFENYEDFSTAFDKGFDDYYIKHGRLAGTYTYNDAHGWSVELAKIQKLRTWQEIIDGNLRDSLSDGAKYIGEINNETPDGIGLQSFHYIESKVYYFGEWNKNTKHGTGVYIVANWENDSHVPYCPECKYFVGSWENDKKSGNGICYNKNGKIIYIGDFNNDKPVDTYPSEFSYVTELFLDSKRFVVMSYQYDKSFYIGEDKHGKREGQGIHLWQSGELWYGHWKDNNRKGHGIRIHSSGLMEIGEWNDEK